MAYSITCQCGKRLVAKQPLEGKRVRCPACGQIVGSAIKADTARPPSSKTPHMVFVSHSAKDKATASVICSALESKGVRCWIAPRDIVAGTEWGEAIITGITTCRIMVLIYSGHSNQSPQVRREVERAVNKGLIIIPFRIEDVPMAKSLEYFLSSPHWLDALSRPIDPHVQQLVSTIQALLKDGPEAANVNADRILASVGTRAPIRSRRSLVWAGGAVGAAVLALVTFLLLNRSSPEESQAKAPEKEQAVAANGNDAPRAALPPSEIALRQGTLQVRSTGLIPNPSPIMANAGDKAVTPRLMMVSNVDESAKWPLATPVRLQFQITNNSYEVATLSRAEVALLGIVDLYEDRIAEPRPPQLLKAIESRELPFGRPRTVDVGETKTMFRDPNDPPSPLRFEAQSDVPEVAQATIDPAGKVRVEVPSKKGGVGTLRVIAKNAFDLTAATSFTIRCEPKPPRILKTLPPRELEIKGPQTLADVGDLKTLFADPDNDPPTELKYQVKSDAEDIAKPMLDKENKLQLVLPAKRTGTALITVSATNAYQLKAEFVFPVRVTVVVPTTGAKATSAKAQEMVVPSIVNRQAQPFPTVDGNAQAVLGIGKFEVEKEVLRLTNVQFAYSLKRGQLVKPCLSGNLVPEDADVTLKANSAKRVSVDVACPTSWHLPDGPKDLLSGTNDRRLAALSPELVGSCHLFVIVVEVFGEDGVRQQLYSDRVFAVYSSTVALQPETKVFNSLFSRGEEKDLDQLPPILAKWCLKAHAETLAYQRAKQCGAVPATFDASAVTGMCFYGDKASAFRTSSPSGAPADAWPRTNLVPVLREANTAHPKLAALLTASLQKLAGDADPALARRGAFVNEHLGSGLAGPELIESKPPRHVTLKSTGN